MNKQYRNFQIECRKSEDEKTDSFIVEGYATTFEENYCMGENDKYRLFERVAKTAFDNAQMEDVIFQYDHEGRVFARQSNNTLELEKDEHGLKVRANLGGTEEGRKLYNDIKGGYINKMSFAFTVLDTTDERKKAGDGKTDFIRTITRIGRVFDVSAVSIPANDKTEISARKALEEIEQQIELERRSAEEEKAKEDDQKKLEEEKKKENETRQRLALEISFALDK